MNILSQTVVLSKKKLISSQKSSRVYFTPKQTRKTSDPIFRVLHLSGFWIGVDFFFFEVDVCG